jgi:PhnB protein
MIMRIDPYITFNGNCEEAFEYYSNVFSSELSLSRFKDMPSDSGMNYEDHEKEHILHVSMPIGDSLLMGSDSPRRAGKAELGNALFISVNADTEEESRRIFNELSKGGNVIMPMEKSFWNAYFGMCVDKFGVSWMVSYDYSHDNA